MVDIGKWVSLGIDIVKRGVFEKFLSFLKAGRKIYERINFENNPAKYIRF